VKLYSRARKRKPHSVRNDSVSVQALVLVEMGQVNDMTRYDLSEKHNRDLDRKHFYVDGDKKALLLCVTPASSAEKVRRLLLWTSSI